MEQSNDSNYQFKHKQEQILKATRMDDYQLGRHEYYHELL